MNIGNPKESVSRTRVLVSRLRGAYVALWTCIFMGCVGVAPPDPADPTVSSCPSDGVYGWPYLYSPCQDGTLDCQTEYFSDVDGPECKGNVLKACRRMRACGSPSFACLDDAGNVVTWMQQWGPDQPLSCTEERMLELVAAEQDVCAVERDSGDLPDYIAFLLEPLLVEGALWGNPSRTRFRLAVETEVVDVISIVPGCNSASLGSWEVCMNLPTAERLAPSRPFLGCSFEFPGLPSGVQVGGGVFDEIFCFSFSSSYGAPKDFSYLQALQAGIDAGYVCEAYNEAP